jgi:glycosyltransferase involved in cell wall biosynthesis
LAAIPRRNLLMLVQMPPPVHGVAMANHRLVNHRAFGEAFAVRTLAINPPAAINAIGQLSVHKATHNVGVLAHLLPALRWADAAYLTPGTQGPAIWRDWLLTRVCRMAGTPYVLHFHCSQVGEDDRGSRLSSRASAAIKASLAGAAGHLLLGASLRSGFEGFIPVQAPCVPVGNGVPLPAAATPNPSGPLRLGFLGNLVHYKGVTHAIEIVATLAGVELDVVGDFHSDAYCQRVHNLVSARGVVDRVHFHGGLSSETAWDRLAGCHAMLSTSDWREGLSLVWLEALARGIPVVSSAVGMADEVLGPIDPRLVQPVGDHSAFVAAIQALTADSQAYEALRQRCRSRALACYGTDAWVARVISGLNELLPCSHS